jgi:hypothetical protein
MNAETTMKPATRSRRRIWPKILLVVLLIGSGLLSLLALLFYGWNAAAERALQEAIEEVDRTEPGGWRLEQVEAARAVIPDEKNAGLAVLAVADLLPKKLPDGPRWEDMADLPPPVQLNEEEVRALRSGLAPLVRARNEARRLVAFTSGRYAVRWTDDVFSTLLPHVDKIRPVMWLLDYDARLRLQEGDAEGAWLSGRAILHAARSLGDEPLAISQLVRVAGRELAVRALERILAQGTVSAKGLAEAQAFLSDESGQPLTVLALRGERAGYHHLFTNLENGTIDLSALAGSKQSSAWDRVSTALRGPEIRRAHAWLLRYLTEAVAVAKRSGDGQAEALLQQAAELADAPLLAQLLLPALTKVMDAIQRTDADLRCAVAGLAAERYRLGHGRWPQSLQALVAEGLLARVPTDPYDGQPLRLRAAPDGVVIYSVGETGAYQGDDLDQPDYDPRQPRLEFRLWHPDRRRQPPRPSAPPPGEGPAADPPGPGG